MAELQGHYVIAMKRLAEVEVGPRTSHQHELNGVAALRQLLGTSEEVRSFPNIEWVLLRDDADPVREHHSLSWYNSRRNQPNRPAEWRLYYAGGTTAARAGDLFVLIQREAKPSLAVVVARAGSTWEQQLVTIFDKPLDPSGGFTTVELSECPGYLRSSGDRTFRIESVGVRKPSRVQECRSRMKRSASSGSRFRTRSRSRSSSKTGLKSTSGEPDTALLAWWSAEEAHFREHETTDSLRTD